MLRDNLGFAALEASILMIVWFVWFIDVINSVCVYFV